MTSLSADPRHGPALVREVPTERPPALVHSEWAAVFPWLVHGCTTRGSDDAPFDLGLFTEASPAEHVRACWTELYTHAGMSGAVHAKQVHEAGVRFHAGAVDGLVVEGEFDGHVTDEPGVLLGICTADCVPIFMVDPVNRAVGVLHAGWRGAAAGVQERGLAVMAERFGTVMADVHVHVGPSICGACYEVGPEVFESLDQTLPEGPTPIDLRRLLADRAVVSGVLWEHITISVHCTRCTDSGLYSHRGGDRERQVGYIGISP
ncbi:MAG: polyphenol oxidase family protein [Gemmatimonadales bacterium]|nr:polyphenol oxidase family protein [Gemmatimonadales bacterium]MBT7126671.1 polyphenol oxidase family protein [Gemmatimonadales bacterium]MBT7694160.1 polyphenol oxidase family protein [Gemmatimonadales bacterium]